MITCPECDEVAVRRVRRKGFLERRILYRWSIFPLQCGRCGRRFLSRLPTDLLESVSMDTGGGWSEENEYKPVITRYSMPPKSGQC